ncbi:hypothetical protein F4819DRAFT_389471 [Hypoxylon fuscum]|nr:hypothetical protein F4819DRAFT_389471 [Hypoxylon fuscum]
MAYHFPKKISAARVATFISTAAWIQGTSASEASLPEEALNNFLGRHGITTVSARQAPAPEEEEVEEEEGEESVDSLSSSSVDTPGAPPSVSTESDEEEEDNPSLPDSPQAGIAQGASGQPAIGSTDPPALSMGAKVAIGVWSAVAVFAIAGLIFFFNRRRRRARMALQEVNDLRDEEIARSQRQMSEQIPQRISGPIMSLSPPPPPPPAMEPVYLRGGDGGSVRAPSGQWMATPPWQDDAPTWRDSHPWRTSSHPSVVAVPNGLPAGPKPGFVRQSSRPEFDRRTEFTADTESTIFAYR